MTIKICHIVSIPSQDGIESPMSHLVRHLEGPSFESHVVAVTRRRRTGTSSQRTAIARLESWLDGQQAPVHRISYPMAMGAAGLVEIHRLIRRIAPGVVHHWSPTGNDWASLAVAFARKPTVVTLPPISSKAKPVILKWLARRLMNRARCLAVESQQLAQRYSQYLVPQQPLHVVPYAASGSASTMSRDELFHRLKLPPRRYVIGAIGPLIAENGYPDLIFAAELLRVALKDVWFMIVGDGPQRQYLQRLRDQYGAQDVVRFLGRRNDAQELWSSFDLLWSGSTSGYQVIPILNAMAAGVPVIAPDTPDNRQRIVHGKTGMLFQVGDVGSLARSTFNLIQDFDRRQKMSLAALQYSSAHFPIEKMVAEYSAIYSNLIG